MNLQGKKVLVTGASGFIGSHLGRRLLQLQAEVVGVSRKDQKNDHVCSHWMKADLADQQSVQGLLKKVKPNVIFHLASHVVGARDIEQVMPTFQDNLASTVNILVEATHINCEKIILIGSLEEPDGSDTFIVPSSPYAAAKFAASAYGRMFHRLYDLPVTIARLFMVYGPDQRDLSKLVPYVILSLLEKKVPQLSSGSRLVDWIYVHEVVDGLIAMAVANNVNGKTIDIGSGNLISIRDMVTKISQFIDPEIELAFGSLSDRKMEQVRSANIEDTFKLIGWRPENEIEKNILETIQWYKNPNPSEFGK